MAESDRRARRIVVALDTGSRAAPTVEAAAALALATGSPLAALFVEDERLLQLAALPFAREVGFPSARLEPFSLAGLERAFRAQAQMLRRSVEEIARRLSIEWSLDVLRGDILLAAFERLRPEDVLVVGRGLREGLVSAERRTGGGPFPSLAARPVTLVFEDTGPGLEALAAAHALASTLSADLAVLIHAPGPETFRALRERAGNWLAARGAVARYAVLPELGVHALARAVRQQHSGVLLWPAAPMAGERRALGRVLESIPCTVVLLR